MRHGTNIEPVISDTCSTTRGTTTDVLSIAIGLLYALRH